jgi:NAD+ synthase (glutamine-hydrolysing)
LCNRRNRPLDVQVRSDLFWYRISNSNRNFRLVYTDIVEKKNPQVLKDLLMIVGEPSSSSWLPKSPQEIASRLMHTAYLGMAENSSPDTRARSKNLAKDIGSYHLDLNIDTVYHAVTALFSAVTNYVPKYKMYGGTPASNLALQNIQARLRMVLSYLFAQLLPTVRGRNANNPQNSSPGGLLVLGSANVDESLRGYLTKYDCSSADINPIGGISKTDLKRFILWASTNFNLPILQSFIDAPPTAELEPITHEYTQSDEADMGMTYDELSIYGRLRKNSKLGPYGMWSALLHQWGDTMSPQQIYEKVRWFFWCYGINRHKMTTLTPSYHAEQYSPDDNRFDLRPFLYPGWDWAWKKIEKSITAMGERGTKVPVQVEDKNEETKKEA